MILTVVPAYGRDYKSRKAALADWQAGKDFLICCIASPHDGRYINREDAERDHVVVSIRYKSLTMVTGPIRPSS